LFILLYQSSPEAFLLLEESNRAGRNITSPIIIIQISIENFAYTLL